MTALLIGYSIIPIVLMLCYLFLSIFHRTFRIEIKKVNLLYISVICVSIFLLNFYVALTLFWDHRSGSMFDDFFLLLLYYNLILFFPFKLLDKNLRNYQLILLLQATFTVIYFTFQGWFLFFSSTAYYDIRFYQYIMKLLS